MKITVNAEIKDWEQAENLLTAVISREIKKFNWMNEITPHQSTNFTYVCGAGRVETKIEKDGNNG